MRHQLAQLRVIRFANKVQLADAEFTASDGSRRKIQIYYDQKAPGVADWKKLHFPSLQSSHSLLLERIPVTWKRSLHVGSNWCILAG